MAHPSSSPPCDSSAVHSSTTVKALSSIISQTCVQPHAGLHVSWSTPLAQTTVVPARESHGANPLLAAAGIPQCSSPHDAVTIVGDMAGLNLMQVTSSVGSSILHAHIPSPPGPPSDTLHSQPTIAARVVHHSFPIINPNLRHIARRFLGRQPPTNTVHSDIIDDRAATTMAEPQEAVHKEPLSGTTSISMNGAVATPPLRLATTVLVEDLIDSEEENMQQKPNNQKRKQRNIQTPSPPITVINTAKRRVASESSDTSEDVPQKRQKLKHSAQAATSATNLPRFNSGSATSDTDHVPPRSASSSNRHSSSSIEVFDGVVVRNSDGPKSIADAYNTRVESSVARRDNPPKKSGKVSVSVELPVRAPKKSGGGAVATSSRVRVEDMQETADVETADHQRAKNHASVVSRKVRRWADRLKGIHTAYLEALFDEEIIPMSGREILELLKEIDEDKNWATRAEIEDSHLEQFLSIVVDAHLANGTEAHKLATLILDNFAQRFHNLRYPRRR
ncbi:uncharacterized protein EDB91DRAFT_1286345 [Suillus paluster]|uniref:uncharacterized protein n=1 Tax=Suillus paluster TaxID=48578 RepID=UPI001B8783AC|nr:uncharacterized protein EDB91DRAFT_1286345 [Suillus paluster]KAG1753757.1 hypothetical protein EDB91DRAFT_1286345 [Suillus paluster]